VGVFDPSWPGAVGDILEPMPTVGPAPTQRTTLVITASPADESNKIEISCDDFGAALRQVRPLLRREGWKVSVHDRNGNQVDGPALEAVAFPPVMGAIETAVIKFDFAVFEPIFFATRRRRRLKKFGFRGLDQLTVAEIDLRQETADCVPACKEIVEAHRGYLTKYAFAAAGRSRSWVWRGVPLLIDLARYPDFDAYAGHLARRSKGAAMRQIRKARRLGFYCKPFDRRYHRLDLYRIDTSKRFRSGPVLAAFLRRMPAHAVRPSTTPEPNPPPCFHHWYVDWGVFVAAAGDERLVGYLYLKRIGEIARVTALMGHGDYLREGIVKLLFVEVMRWLLDHRDPHVRGIRYLHYGAIQHGNAGLTLWKDRFQFEPFLFRYADPAFGRPGRDSPADGARCGRRDGRAAFDRDGRVTDA
jgi:hypothetical protein